MARSSCIVVMGLLALPGALAAQGVMVRSATKISKTTGAFGGHPGQVGSSVAPLGDLDGDGKSELAVGASGDSDAGQVRGAVWIFSLNPDGTVASHTKILDPA